jgi:hypothetical protein
MKLTAKKTTALTITGHYQRPSQLAEAKLTELPEPLHD